MVSKAEVAVCLGGGCLTDTGVTASVVEETLVLAAEHARVRLAVPVRSDPSHI